MLREDMPEAYPDPEKSAQLPYTREAPSAPADVSAETGSHVHIVPCSRYVLDESMRIVYADESFEKMTGYSPEEVQTSVIHQADLIPEEERTEYLCTVNALLSKNTILLLEHKIRRKDGSIIYVFCSGRVYFDSVTRQERSEIIIVDLVRTHSMKLLADAEQSKAQVRLKYWEDTYRRDPLTGLMNHAAFRSDVELKLLGGRCTVVMLMADVDKFKQYNDRFGHHNGDKFLILVAQALSLALRKEDCACRLGGDEFAAALFFDSDTRESVIMERVQQIYDKVNIALKGIDGGTGISMGAALAAPDTTFNQLYEASDMALYQAKESGRGRLVLSPGSPAKL